MADEDPDPRIFGADILLLGEGRLGRQLVPRRGEQVGNRRRRGRTLDDRLGDILRPGEGAAGEDPGLGGLDRGEVGGGGELVGRQLDTGRLRQLEDVLRGLQPDREDDHVVVLLDLTPLLVDVMDAQVAVGALRLDAVDAATDETDARFILGPLEILVEILAVGPHIHIEDRRRQPRDVILGDDRLLDRVHAADRRAVAVAAQVLVAGTDALQEGDLGDRLAVGGTDQMALGRSGGRQIALELEGGDDVRHDAVAPDLGRPGIVGLKAGGEDDGADVDLMGLLGIVEIDRPGVADLLAEAAGPRFLQPDAADRIDLVLQRHRLGILDIDGLAFAGAGVVLAVHLLRTFLGTGAAGNALVHVHIPWRFFDRYGKVPGSSGYPGYFAQGHQLDI